jgi:ABC-2 type transport system ATP-binding protein
MTDSDVTLRVQNVTKRFGDFTAVDDLSFDVRRGRVFGFLGPNGAGKTTTIRMIVGITAPDEGTIEYNFLSEPRASAGGQNQGTPNGPPAHASGSASVSSFQDRIGYLPEERGLYKKLKIVDQLRYFAALKGVSRAEADKRIDLWLDRMKLSEWKSKRTTDLSKGMQQKIQFISTVLHDPDLLILDEPFSGLDPVNVEFMIDVLAEFRTKDKTIMFSTHQMETAERLCSDILLINKAKKVVSGSLREIKESFGKNMIALRAIGGNGVLQDKALVSRTIEHADEIEVQLNDGVDSQTLLKRLLESGARVEKFEQIEPSLNDIFIEKVSEG